MATAAPPSTRPELTTEQIDGLAAQVRGNVITPASPDYDTARKVYNGMIDKRPAVIVQCTDVADVMAGVNFGRDNGLLVAIRGGGHNAAGLGTCDDGIVLDLGPMKSVHVNPTTRIVRVGGGAVWGDVDHATQPFGLGVSAGVISTTGVGGLALGGGFGYTARAFGLTIDNIISADMVLADGSFVTASADEHPDLYWAIRGGGGNFGVVTSFEFQAHPIGMVSAGVLFYELDKAAEVMRLYREFIKDAPRELALFFGYLMAPPAPFIPESLHMRNMAKMVVCYNGSMEDLNRVIKPFLDLEPTFPLLMSVPLAAWNSAFDALFPPDRQDYWKADYVHELTDEMIDIHLQYGPKMPNPSSIMHIYSLNGAVQDIGADETAYSYRDADFVHVMLVTDDDPEKMPAHIDYTRAYWDALHPLAAGGAYVNFMMDEGSERVQAGYRGNYARLQQIKAKYDPDNVFRVNQNIKPRA